ncbi:MAG: ABC transporter ATP-binding protein [Erysipelotrichaceae bacterium]|jgi:ATP-binding cassette subfamily B multidrug efflux pump
MAKIEKEKVITSYSGNVFKRIFGYMKPYFGRFMLSIFMILAVTAFEIIRPMLIAKAIDTYIEGYDHSYAIVNETEADLSYNGLFLTKDYKEDEVSSYCQIVLYDDKYYYFENLDAEQVKVLIEKNNAGIEKVEAEKENFIMISDENGNLLEGKRLLKDDLKVLRSSDYKGIFMIGIIYLIVLVLNALIDSANTYTLLVTGQHIIYDMRNELFAHVHSLPLRFFDTHPVGQIDTRITNDVESLNRMFSHVLVNLIRNFIMIAGYALVMLTLNSRLAIITFIYLPVIFIITNMFRKISRNVYRVERTKLSYLNTFLSEHISGMKLIQIFAREKEKFAQFEEKSDDLYNTRIKELLVFAFFRPFTSLIANLALVAIVYKGSHYILSDSLTVGVLFIFISYIRSFFWPIQEMAQQFSTLQNSFASAEKIFSLLDEKSMIEEPENPIRPEKIKGKIEFRNVWFAYENENWVLKDVSFVIEPGQKVAFVGATGAGKSSIMNLIARYYDIQKGEILIDDINIKEMSLNQIRNAIGQVQQDVFIFTGDVKSNIRLLNEDITMEQIIEAAKAVNAHQFIESLPDKYDEMLTERGTNLSFGQRQLLSFARTLVINPTILVMDEATANIDTETELLIQEALKTLMENRTTIMVAHRLSTIQHADNIIVLDLGQIIESGTHQELLTQDGIYKKLYELQKYDDESEPSK